MSKIENVNIAVSENFSGQPIVIHLLEGPAPEPIKVSQPISILIEGDIFAPVAYANENLSDTRGGDDQFPTTTAIVKYSDNPKSPWIKLTMFPNRSINETVTGSINLNKDLAQFRFNDAGAFTNKTFAEMIMKHPHCFANKGEAKTLRKSLQNYNAKFNTIVQKANDNQGNTEDMIKTEFDKSGSGIPSVINLKMPLYDGGDSIEFSAEVEVEVAMTSGKPEARFAFFTEELELLQRQGAKDIVALQIQELAKKFVCIRVNS
jgi:hypothetical protein